MGWLSHIYEAVYYFDGAIDLGELSEDAKSTISSLRRFSLSTTQEAIDAAFPRHVSGEESAKDKHYNLKQHIYLDQTPQNEQYTIYATWTSFLFRFTDDIALSFGQSGQKTFVKVLSCSRVGEGDMYANMKHGEEILNGMKHHFVSKVVIRS
eukprot:TRINITY_DN8052_c0_g1_i1.p1 TRINITY_DN8052_c0_g1~~TRINITY_DN8052_c0_g1_i1.p1  ORF type:complete len:167 (-),score=41.01 TRINITY_DN8052_c0_g1_i1:220-675(-)